MVGLNQTIMMALSMVVVAALIVAEGGLGNPVVLGLNMLEIGLAIVLDRITLS